MITIDLSNTRFSATPTEGITVDLDLVQTEAHASSHEEGGSDAIQLEDLPVTDDVDFGGNSLLNANLDTGAHASTHEAGGNDEIQLEDLPVTGDVDFGGNSLLNANIDTSTDPHATSHEEGGGDELQLENIAVTGDVDFEGHSLLNANVDSGGGGVSFDVVDVTNNGAAGDGVTDDTIAIQNLLDSTSDAVIYFPAGSYLISSVISVSNDNLILAGDGRGVSRILADASDFNSQNAIQVEGSEIETHSMDQAASGDTQVSTSTASNAGNYSRGDFVYLSADNNFSTSAVPEKEPNFVVSADGSTGTIELARPVEGDYTSVPQITRYDPVRNFVFRDLAFEHPDRSDTWYGMAVTGGVGTRIQRARFNNCDMRSLTLADGFDAVVENCHFEGSTVDGYGYGINVATAQTHTRILDSVFREFRHAVAHSSSSAGGIPRHSLTQGCTIEQPNYTVGLDAHEEAEYVKFRDNQLSGCGIGLRGHNQAAVDNDLRFPSEYGIKITGLDVQRGLEVRNNRIEGSTSYGIVSVGVGVVGSHFDENDIIEAEGSSAIAFLDGIASSSVNGNFADGTEHALYIAASDSNDTGLSNIDMTGNRGINLENGSLIDASVSNMTYIRNSFEGTGTMHDTNGVDTTTSHIAQNIP